MAKKKRLFDEDGNEVTKTKKPFYKRWWFITLVAIMIIGALVGGDEDESAEVSEPETEEVEVVKETEAEELEQEPEEEVEEPEQEPEKVEREPEPEPELEPKPEPEPEEVPREYNNALRAAENYLSFMAFSEKGLYNQLTSEYGDGYPAEAAQYAIDNIEVDYNEQALKSANNYLDIMPMSDSELFNQLTSEYGEQFTAEEAQYAIDNLE